MEKDSKKIIITKAIEQKNLIANYDYCYTDNTQIKQIKEMLQNTNSITLYDTTSMIKRKQGSQVYVNDHINQTGKNPLIKCSPIQFINLTSLYKVSKTGITTISLGKKYQQEKNKHAFPSTNLCLAAILCKKIKPTIKIRGILINSL